jgi:hypothetical protein
MLPKTFRRSCATLGLLTALAMSSSAVFAAPNRSALHHPDSHWGWLARSWAALGCVLTPGGCATSQASPSDMDLDAGCRIDPHGACLQDLEPSQLDAGCHIDPSGACLQDPSSS